MTQVTPTQELVAKDLHGSEWKFKHIFRGSTFVQFLVEGLVYFIWSKLVQSTSRIRYVTREWLCSLVLLL